MSGLTFEVFLVYLDDVIVFSSSFEQWLGAAKSVLRKIRAAGLKLKPSKCLLLQTEVTFLVHIVSAQRIGTDPEKISAVVYWPERTNLREMR